MLLLRCLGQFQIEQDGQPLVLPTRKTAALLTYLALHPEVHGRERLVTLFWGDSGEEQARRSLRTALSTLRKTLGEDCVLADRETVQFNPHYRLWIDAGALRSQAEQVLNQPSPDPSLVDLSLYRGDLLEGFYDEWILRAREELRLLYLRLLLWLVQRWRTQGDYAQAIESAQRIVALDPAEEAAHQHLLFCYTASGDRNAARQQYEACVRALREELDVEPAPETVALYRRSQQSSVRAPTAAAIYSNLPIPLASFIGRTHEIAKLKGLLLGHSKSNTHPPARLVTVTGAGGCGKTRLTIQVARELLDVYADGVWWVDLAALNEDTQVSQAVAKVLDVQQGVQPSLTDVLISHLRTKQMLLVLDNCEHLVTACAMLAEQLLSYCPHLQILATSREALGIFGETSWLVPSLSLPAAQQNSPGELLQFEGIRLFVERASAVQRDFALTVANAPVVLQLCRQLDGIPLAIELAAARVKFMTVEQMATRLGGVIGARFELLTDGSRTVLPRQQTLRATMEWSYTLLSEQEQHLLQQLSVFAGGWTLEAAEALGVGLGPQPVATVLARLVDKSLVLAEQQGAAVRYRMLETILQYAHEQLAKSDIETAARRQHCIYFLHLAEEAAQHFRGPAQAEWLDRLATEHGNLRAALTWALTNQPAESGARLGIALWRFWYIRGYYEEGWQWLQRLLNLVNQPAQRAHLLYGGGQLARRRGVSAEAADCFKASLALFRTLEDPRGIASTLRGLGFIHYHQGEIEMARPLFEEALALFRALDDKEGIAVTLDNLGYITNEREQEWRYHQQSLALRRQSGNLHGITNSLAGLAYHAIHQGDHTTARVYLQEHLQINEALGNQNGMANGLAILGQIAFMEGDYSAAQMLYEKSQQLCHESGDRSLLVVPVTGQGIIAIQRGEYTKAHLLLGQALGMNYAAGKLTDVAMILGYLATLAVAQDQAARALSLAGAATALCGATPVYGLTFEQTAFEQTQAAARQRLGPEATAKAWTAGQAMLPAQAVAFALEQSAT